MNMLESAAMSPDLIIVNGNVRTLNPHRPNASALLFRAGEIVFVGDTADALDWRTPHCEILDVQGRLVLPGFTDAHIHFVGFAQSLERVNLEGCRSLEGALERVAARVASAREGETILGRGWNHLDWSSPIFPDKRSLDLVAPANPVILVRKDGHTAWVNSATLRQHGITRETVDPPGGRLDRTSDGEPIGIVRENALDLLGKGIGKGDEKISERSLERAVAIAHQAGVTTIHNIEGANALLAWQSLRESGRLKLHVIHAIPADRLDQALDLGIQRRLGDEWLRLQAVKIFADGSLGSKTAEMREPYAGDDDRGIALTDSDKMLRLSRACAEGGLDVWIHAIGDAAISRVLDTFQTLRWEGLEKPIFRIEHVQHVNPADVSRFAKLGVIASMQPIHQPSDMRMVDALLGPERACTSYAWNSLQKAGAILAFGSDCPVESLEPLRGIHAAVTRQNSNGEPAGGWIPGERLTVEEAVKAYTLGAAAASGDLDTAGSFAVGKRADAVVLSQDIFGIPPREILNTSVSYTIVGGEVVYAA